MSLFGTRKAAPPFPSTASLRTAPTVVGKRERIGYALGDTGFNFLFDMGQLYLLIFFTDQLRLNPAVAGSVFLVAKIWDAFADLTVGSWVDNRRRIGKRGRLRAFMFWGTIPLALTLIATFWVPDFDITGRTIWAFAIYMVFGTVYAIANIPYGSLISVMTTNPQERSVLASLRQAGGSLGLLIATVAFWPIVNAFGEGHRETGYLVAVTAFAIAGSALVFFSYSSVRERYTQDMVGSAADKETRVPLRVQFATLAKNRPLIGLCVANLVVFSAFNLRLAVQVYFATYVLRDTWALSFIGLFSIACVFPGVAIVPFLTRRLGKRATYIVGCSIWFVADLLALFFVHDTMSFVVLSCFAFFGSALPNSLNWAMISDCVEYGELKSGFRNQALTYSAFTWFRKVSQALAGFIPGVVLAAVGYQADVQNQSAEALLGIRVLMFGYPLVMCVIAILAILFIYNLTDHRFLEIASELEKRRLGDGKTGQQPSAVPTDAEGAQ
jgi:GPH family glycoside/pentoside/hexuronide:cation symporter